MNAMKHSTKYVLYILMLIIANNSLMASVSFNAKLDSATLLMGNQTIIHLEILQDESQKGHILNEPKQSDTIIEIVRGVEFTKIVRNDTSKVGNNIQINRDYLIQSFDSGLYTIPPFKYVIGVDTFKSKPLTLKVLPVAIDSIYTSIHDYADLENVESKWFDILPNWVIDYWGLILIIFVIILGIIAVIYILKSKGKSILPRKKVIPPYELAMIKLTKLKELRLCENGQEKEFYTQLTDILREYLTGRFNINAMEMTTTQIINSLKSNKESQVTNNNMELILEMADFVKFAKVRPLPDDNTKVYQAAIQFVTDTKPEEILENNNK